MIQTQESTPGLCIARMHTAKEEKIGKEKKDPAKVNIDITRHTYVNTPTFLILEQGEPLAIDPLDRCNFQPDHDTRSK